VLEAAGGDEEQPLMIKVNNVKITRRIMKYLFTVIPPY
jgi:hypothetical protein